MFFLLFAPGDGLAQDASAILQATLEKYEQRTAGINDYTVTQSVMGREVTTHLRKQMVDGRPVFVLANENASAQENWNPYRVLPQLGARARIVGTERIDGADAHGMQIDDFTGLDIGVPADVQGEFRPQSLTLWIDAGEHLLRRMDMTGVVTAGGQERPLTMTARLLDYRTVEGMPYPFRTAFQVEGMMAMAGASDQEAAQARKQLAELDRKMAEMPAAQREMMERMMGSKLEQMRKMVQSGAFEMEIVVTDLKVNTGPPDGSSNR